MCVIDVSSVREVDLAPPRSSEAPGLGGWRTTVPAALAAFLVFAGSFANLLFYHQYPFLRAEVLILLAACGGIAIVYWALYRFSQELGRALLEASLTYMAIDLNSDFYLAAAVVAALVGVTRHVTKQSLLPIISIMSAVVLASAVTGFAEARPPLSRSGDGRQPVVAGRPAVLHVVLDEHGGIAGIPDPAVRATLVNFYTRNGFHLFSRAYSRHFQTANAIPDVLNFGSPGHSRGLPPLKLEVGPTSYFSSMRSAGYRLHFYQSEFAEFCKYYPDASCTRYWSPSLAFVEPLPIAAGEKARLIAFKLADLSVALKALGDIYDAIAPQLGAERIEISFRARSGTLGGFAALGQLTSDVRSARPGELHFAHLLVPHYPYVVTRDCAVLPPSRWEFRHSDQPLQTRQAASQEQLLCLVKRLDTLVTAFRASPAGRDGIIVIHGDHGSRVTNRDPRTSNRDRLAAVDLLAGYSTLFAVSARNLQPALDPTPAATPDILATLTRNGFSSLRGLERANHRVFLDGGDWNVGESASMRNAWPA